MAKPTGDKDAYYKTLVQTVLTTKGESELEVRAAVFESVRDAVATGSDEISVDGKLGEYCGRMVVSPATADVGILLDDGHSEDAAFEIVLAAAIGLGNARYQAGMQALEALDEA